jgi:hypothetical protein
MIDKDKFFVICRLMADGNTVPVSALRVKSSKKEFIRYAKSSRKNYRMYCRAVFLMNKANQNGKPKRMFFYSNSWLNIREKRATEMFLNRRGAPYLRNAHSH